jgi:hypothetical protein
MKERTMLEWTETMERLEAVAEALEQTAERIAEQQVAIRAQAEQSVGRIVATVESAREAELERRLAETESRLAETQAKLAELTAAAAPQVAGRLTLPAGVATLLAKQGVPVEAGSGLLHETHALDGALASLSIEQRIAVKSELMRAGLFS